jgi:hypothetical protein
MQGVYHPDKPFSGRYRTFFAVTVYQAAVFEIVRKWSKNWTLFSQPGSIAGLRVRPYL